MLGRNIARFVIDEAHCFSSWGQDFRVDYLYIGDFIAQLQGKKHVQIPVSCFTATAKQKVISDVCEYFQNKLKLDLKLFATAAARENLRYGVKYCKGDEEKYGKLRELIEQKNCPTIVYASRTKRAVDLAEKLVRDNIDAKAFHGKMNSDEKIANQNAFLSGKLRVIVATSAFGMGVDKPDVKLVVHYNISDSLENYVQEAGRAGRNQSIQAECYVLFNEEDLDKHFLLLNQTKLSINEIQQIWKGIKELSRNRSRLSCSALEIARKAGWDDSNTEIETKVRTAISALETSGYIKRGQNCPRVYADSIQVRTAEEAVNRIHQSIRFDTKQKEQAVRIIKKLISTRSRSHANTTEAESRVDYIADHLAIEKKEVIESINLMREEGILASDKEMTVFIESAGTRINTRNVILSRYLNLERYLLEQLQENGQRVHYKAINEEALKQGVRYSSVSKIKLLLHFWVIKQYIHKPEGEVSSTIVLEPMKDIQELRRRFEQRVRLLAYVEDFFYEKTRQVQNLENKTYIAVNFSLQELKRGYENIPRQIEDSSGIPRYQNGPVVGIKDIEEALLYLSQTNAFRLEGGFLVLYNAMEITRLINDNKIRYKQEDYRNLKEFYQNKTQQIHIVGEYANMMVKDYQAALTFVHDYFQMDYKLFLTKYFLGKRQKEINENITPMKYQKLFGNLSERQGEIIKDDVSKAIVVAAGPGSGKTMILVHKLASLMLMEDVKQEQLLMLTFSRAAATEFKKRLADLIGKPGHYVEIKTFHSYCFDLLGKMGNIENSSNVVKDATEMIRSGEVELDRITKTVLVIDEAQDMSEEEYQLVKALLERNEEMRIIAVGDDDQNIYEFRKSKSEYMQSFLQLPTAKKYELVENYRSNKKIVGIANIFVKKLSNRFKIEEIKAMKEEQGRVVLVRCNSFLEMAAINLLKKTLKINQQGTVAILTATNEQAYLVTHKLKQMGYHAKLLQSNEGFSLPKMAELNFFLAQLQGEGAIIGEEAWKEAIKRLEKIFSRSQRLKDCLYLLAQFECMNQRKYYTDLVRFLEEIHLEDFSYLEKGEIYVSTIHKVKGKEFDIVYMLVNDRLWTKEEGCRSIYVGMTRAKCELYILHETSRFDPLQKEMEAVGVEWERDDNTYSEPEEIEIPSLLNQVWLDFAKRSKIPNLALCLQSGDKLQVSEERSRNINVNNLIFKANIQGKWIPVAYGARSMKEKVEEQKRKGYFLHDAYVGYVVKWWDRQTEKEYDVVLPVLLMKKKSQNASK